MHPEKYNIHSFPIKLRYRLKTSSENLISMHLILVSVKESIVIIEDPKQNYILSDKIDIYIVNALHPFYLA